MVFKARTYNARYFNGTMAGLTSCVVILATDSTTLVGIIGTISFYFFLLWQVFLAWPILPQFDQVSCCLTIV